MNSYSQSSQKTKKWINHENIYRGAIEFINVTDG